MSSEDVIKIYESVQSVLETCCLTDVQQLKQIKEVRTIYQGDLDSRPLGHSISIGLTGVVVALFAAACSLVGGGTHSFSLINYIEYIILGMLILGPFLISSSTCKQKISSTIVSAIDDTLEAVKNS